MAASLSEHGATPQDASQAVHRQFKKHKVLPRPQDDRGRNMPHKQNLALDTSDAALEASDSQSLGSRTLKHQPRLKTSRPSLPPTPPVQARTSSNSPSSPIAPLDNLPIVEKSQPRAPATPPEQNSPPTPDVTPPQPVGRPKAIRPSLGDRGASRNTTFDSRADSFQTAREEPMSSDEDDAVTARPSLSSRQTSQATVRRMSDSKQRDENQSQNLTKTAPTASVQQIRPSTGRSTRNDRADRPVDVTSEQRHRDQVDDRVQRAIAEKKVTVRPPRAAQQRKANILEDNVIPQTEATRAARHMALHEKIQVDGAKQQASREKQPQPRQVSRASTLPARAKSSSASVKSEASTVVEAYLVKEPPRRQHTLRHVRKHRELRESSESSPNSTVHSLDSERSLPPQILRRSEGRRHDSVASWSSTASISSRRDRREILKSGAIPVVVIPDRQSSSKSKSSREPSLRSTSSRRSRVTTSIASAPLVEYVDSNLVPVFERPSRRSRRYSESDSRDERTIDYPPKVPARSSSLSAPTSRNTSRAGSMKADSIKALNVLEHSDEPNLPEASPADADNAPSQIALLTPPNAARSQEISTAPVVLRLHVGGSNDSERKPSPAASAKMDKEDVLDKLDVDHQDDAMSSKKFSSRNTPFSTHSFETSGTAPEVSEAMAVQMYPHQNSSVLMVDNSSKAAESPEAAKKEDPITFGQPKITMTAPGEQEPVTPPQTHFCIEDVDSPLRNPRAPPEPPANPPAINFIPATPSGLTPAHDKAAMMGNYFETMGEKPGRRPSLVKRALNRRRRMSLDYPPSAAKTSGFLTRTFSLSRHSRRASDAFLSAPTSSSNKDYYPQEEDEPAEGNKLHPFWRPLHGDETFDDFDEDNYDDHDQRVFRYPLVDNRPRPPRRSLSDRMRRTFAVFPINDDYDDYDYDSPTEGHRGPERRTIRRTPSGSLKVVRHSLSAESLKRRRSLMEKTYSSLRGAPLARMWPGYRVSRKASKGDRRRFSIADIQSIPRRYSEKRRERRNEELRAKISGPTEVRDGVEDMIRTSSTREPRMLNGHL